MWRLGRGFFRIHLGPNGQSIGHYGGKKRKNEQEGVSTLPGQFANRMVSIQQAADDRPSIPFICLLTFFKDQH